MVSLVLDARTERSPDNDLSSSELWRDRASMRGTDVVEVTASSDSVANSLTDPWVARLRDSAAQAAALEELRGVLMRAVSHAFRTAKGGHSFCEDVVQDSLIRILDKLDMFSGRSQFTTWAISIAVRIGTSQLRRKRFQDVSLDAMTSGDNMKFEFADNDTEALDVVEDRQLIIQTLRRLIDETLTDRQRQATDALLNGMPVEEIAARTGSNRNAVYKLVHDARMRLKQGLEKSGFTAEDILSMF